MTAPIELHYWATPNGHKISIALEEMGLPYDLHLVDIGKGEQFRPEFLAIAPNNRMPAIVDPEGPGGQPVSIFESGAILQYLGRKTGQFYGTDERARIAIEQWLMWQMGGLGPMMGQANHFLKYAPQMDPPEVLPYAQNRYRSEVTRLLRVLDGQLAKGDYVAGAYSIADMAIFPWTRVAEKQEQDLAPFPALRDWLARVGERPAVVRGLEVGAAARSDAPMDKAQQEILFGKRPA